MFHSAGFVVSVFLTALSHAALPTKIHPDDLKSLQVIEFHPAASAIGTPLGAQLKINGKPAMAPEKIAEAFTERFLAEIPVGSQIRITKDREGRDVWEYPVGTRVWHEIRFRSKDRKLFELRALERLPNLTWEYGTFAPLESGPHWQRLIYEGAPAFSHRFEHAEHGRAMEVSLNRIPLRTCQNCHFMASPQSYQYRDRQDAGPCGFGPSQPNLIDTWGRAYKKSTGSEPFAR